MKSARQMIQVCIFVSTTAIGLAQALPQEVSTIFAGSGVCADCHMPGGMNPTALTDSRGENISPPELWSPSMMANAAKDPLWQAKVAAEIATHPELQSIIEDKCTTCHAPMGRVEALYHGAESYTMEDMLGDPLAMDGVSCAACHQIQDHAMGEAESFSGHFQIGDDRIIYGPYQNPITGPMNNMVNYSVAYSEHTTQSELCATCHTLFTPYVDDEGAIAGEAPEQVPYLEWLNSDFPAQGIECQTCHMPAVEENIVISNRPAWLNSRTPLHNHEFVGGNVFMLRILRDFGSELGVTASANQFDEAIARTMKMLTEQTVALSLQGEWNQPEDTLKITLNIQNLSGHKFPTAYPSRRAWVELQVFDELNQVVFHSGAWDQAGEISGLDSSYEEHHQIITGDDQTQVYQNVPLDINGNKTYTLLRIAGYLKDNRIPPMGYQNAGIAADSTRIEGSANLDPDFNHSGDIEGTGSDAIHYHIAGLDPNIEYRIEAKMNYQTIAPRFVDDLFSYDLPEVNEFEGYYYQSDLSPITLDSVSIDIATLGIDEEDDLRPSTPLLIETYPNPFNPVAQIRITLANPGHLKLLIYDIQGRVILEMPTPYLASGTHSFSWDALDNGGESVDAGMYLLSVEQKALGSNSVIRNQKKLVYLR